MGRRRDPAYAVRAARRGSWPIRRFELSHEPGDDLSETTTAEQRIEMMWPLACDAWAFAGRGLPDYPRAETPIKVVRPALGGRES